MRSFRAAAAAVCAVFDDRNLVADAGLVLAMCLAERFSQLVRLISDAEVAETPAYTAFTGRKKAEQVTARLAAHIGELTAFPGSGGV